MLLRFQTRSWAAAVPRPIVLVKKLVLPEYLRPAWAMRAYHVDVHGLNGVFVHDMNGFGKLYFDNGWRH